MPVKESQTPPFAYAGPMPVNKVQSPRSPASPRSPRSPTAGVKAPPASHSPGTRTPVAAAVLLHGRSAVMGRKSSIDYCHLDPVKSGGIPRVNPPTHSSTSSPLTTERTPSPDDDVRVFSTPENHAPKTTSASTAAHTSSECGKVVRRSFSTGSFAAKERETTDCSAIMLTMSELPGLMGMTEKALGGRFQVGRILGRGTSATVWDAHHVESRERCAIKVFDKCRTDWSTAASKQAFREARIMGGLEHPCIIRFLETFETNIHFCLVCELVNGGSLRQLLRQQKNSCFEESQARPLFTQACDAIQYCHGRNVAHRDIKLENMLLDKSTGSLKLIDFGFAVQLKGKDHKLRFFCGTPSYMAPEMVTSREYLGFQIDVWALGVVLYVMLTGQFPFAGTTESQLYAKIRRGVFKCPEALGDHAKRLVCAALRVEPQSRPTAEQMLKHSRLDMTSSRRA